MRINEIYHKYKILPTLQTHQFRVAAVGKLIAENSTQQVEIQNIVTTCLLHDIGNIIKFTFDFNPESFQPEGIEYWKGVQAEFIAKYGNDEHNATLKIATEIGVSERILDLLQNVGFSNGKEIYESGDLNKMICAYSDHRVSPTGVLSLNDRIAEVTARYKKSRPEFDTPENDAITQTWLYYFQLMENKIFKNSKLKPEDINDSSICPLMNDFVMQKDFIL